MLRSRLWLTVGALVGVLAVLGGDAAEAKAGRGKGRKRPPRGMLSAHGPTKSRTPGAAGDASAGGSASGPAAPDVSRDVAVSPMQGEGRKDALQGGTAIVLSPTRALVTNPYRGLVIVDVSDPDAPRVLGTVALSGSADRVFVDGSTALVVSQTYDAEGGRTKVTTVDFSDESHPVVVGDVSVDGGLAGAAQSGGELILVTTSYNWGPIYATAGDGVVVAQSGAAGPRKAGADPAHGGVWFPGGNGDAKARVARIGRGASGAPEVVGTVAVSGSLLSHDIDGDDVALVIDDTIWWWGGPVETMQSGAPTDGSFAATGVKIVDVDASGAPTVDGSSLLDLSGVSTLDLTGAVARVVGWTYQGTTRLATFGLGTGVPSALGTLDIEGWPSSTVFTGDRMAFTTTVGEYWYYGGNEDGSTGPGDPAMHVKKARRDGSGPGAPTYPTTVLHVVDLADAAKPALAGSVDLGTGWSGSLQAVGAPGVVATVSDYQTSATRLVRVDLSDAANPAIADSEDLTGSWYGFQVFDDLLLLSGGTYTEEGGYVPSVLPISLADGGLAAGGTIATQSWAAASAWEKPILALSSVDALALYDLSDFAQPTARGTVRLAANVTDLAVLDAKTAACLVTDYVNGAIEVRTVGLPDADALTPIDTVSVGTGDARLFQDGSMLYVLGTDWSTGRGRLTVVDATDPADLRERGSLDLASYPGQAFLVDGALVLLRETWSLVTTDETTGKRKGKADPFGRCPISWTRDELGCVLDVIDLKDPDEPTAAVRRHLRWDFSGQAVLRGTTLYIPTYTSYGWSPDGYERVLYGVRPVDLSDATDPSVGKVVAVPGSLVGAADASGRVLTVSYSYDETTYDFDATMHLVDLTVTNPYKRVLASTVLPGSPGAVVVGKDHAYVSTQTWSYDDGSQSFSLGTYALSDLGETSQVEREQSAWDGRVAGGRLFLRSWGWTGALDVYGLADPANPEFVTRTDVDGVGTTIGIADGRAYVPAGYRGVVGFDLE